MSGLIFQEESLLTNNIFKYEQRLSSSSAKFLEGSAILTTYYNLHENSVTVDRGTRDIEELFGRHSPLRFSRIENFPLYGFGAANPQNNDEAQIEDISVEGECLILPSTIVPHPNDFFRLNHLKMKALFQVVEINYDAMKVEGYYRLRYRLHSTSTETDEWLKAQTIGDYKCELKALGTDLNPIISADDYVRRTQIEKMVSGMIDSYRSMFYNKRHNCFLYHDTNTNERWFDTCSNEFIAKHSIINVPNSTSVIMLHSKLTDSSFPSRYERSVYRWIENDAPLRGLRRFGWAILPSANFRDSSFARWNENDIRVVVPINEEVDNSFPAMLFDHEQIDFFSDNMSVGTNEYDNLLKLFIHGKLDSIQQISLNLANSLSFGLKDIDNFFMTPIIIYIIRKVLSYN